MLKTFHGSCHCGAVAYEVDLDLAKGTGRCNCTFCLKARAWTAFVKPGDFRITRGADSVVSYRRQAEAPEKFHCPTCAVRTHSTGDADYSDGPFVGVFVSTLDDATPEEFADAPIHYSDGRHDNWQNPPKITSYL